MIRNANKPTPLTCRSDSSARQLIKWENSSAWKLPRVCIWNASEQALVEWVFLSGNDKMKFRTNSTQPAEIAMLRAGEFSAWTLWTHNDLCECCETRIVIAVENGSRFHCYAYEQHVSWGVFAHWRANWRGTQRAYSAWKTLSDVWNYIPVALLSLFPLIFQRNYNFNPFYKFSCNLKCGELFISGDSLAKWSFFLFRSF